MGIIYSDPELDQILTWAFCSDNVQVAILRAIQWCDAETRRPLRGFSELHQSRWTSKSTALHGAFMALCFSGIFSRKDIR
jgi:hypothetical protein